MLKRLFQWVRRVFGKPEQRDVLRLPAGDPPPPPAPRTTGRNPVVRAPDLLTESVSRKGVLVPKQRRLVIRDERLMPKPTTPRRWGGPKPAPVISDDEATRLFAGTLRTKNRAHRTLATDPKQLARFGLPVWKTEADVAQALGITVGTLRHHAVHRDRERVPHYVTYAIPKRSGGTRIIHTPKLKLKAILRKLVTELVDKLPVSEHAHGFVRGRSVRTGAAAHINKAVVLRLDLKDFFGTVTMARVRGYLVALGYGYPVAATLAVLATEALRQPVDVDGTLFHVPVGPRTCVQGAPTSPGLCNAIVHKLDRRIAGLAKRAGFAYTRYADDLTLSGPNVDAAHRLRKQIERVIREEGFEVNAAKTRVMTRGGRQRVTGVTVNKVLGLSRQERRVIRAMLHRDDPAQRDRTQGLLAWVDMLNPQQAEALRRRQSTRSERSNSSGFDDA